jgi:hypothetical protein
MGRPQLFQFAGQSIVGRGDCHASDRAVLGAQIDNAQTRQRRHRQSGDETHGGGRL